MSYFVMFNRFGVDLNSTAVENVYCSYSSYLSISQCSLSNQFSSFCSSDSYDLVVTCCKFLHIYIFACICIIDTKSLRNNSLCTCICI